MLETEDGYDPAKKKKKEPIQVTEGKLWAEKGGTHHV